MSKERDKELLKLTNASGFPFQLRVADLVETTASLHGWRVLARDHPWTDSEPAAITFGVKSYRVDTQGFSCAR